ncbi:hypothetical protein [Streptomyces carpinensis]|uniref:Uncharacterized protein n=1 Tax=Streptomyces carpinensis TaxID=66369 RepID=A0ABV1WG07_9ACTN
MNIWKDPDAAVFVRSVADGNKTVPTVTVAGRAMVNIPRRSGGWRQSACSPHLLSETV